VGDKRSGLNLVWVLRYRTITRTDNFPYTFLVPVFRFFMQGNLENHPALHQKRPLHKLLEYRLGKPIMASLICASIPPHRNMARAWARDKEQASSAGEQVPETPPNGVEIYTNHNPPPAPTLK